MYNRPLVIAVGLQHYHEVASLTRTTITIKTCFTWFTLPFFKYYVLSVTVLCSTNLSICCCVSSLVASLQIYIQLWAWQLKDFGIKNFLLFCLYQVWRQAVVLCSFRNQLWFRKMVKSLLRLCVRPLVIWSLTGSRETILSAPITSIISILWLPVTNIPLPWWYRWVRYDAWYVIHRGEVFLSFSNWLFLGFMRPMSLYLIF